MVVMGDHGESLNEHREGTHGFFIYNATHVPLLMRAPFGLAPRRGPPSARRGRHADGARPAGYRRRRQRSQGRTLVPLMTGRAADLSLDAYSESLYPLLHYGWNDLRALRAGRYK